MHILIVLERHCKPVNDPPIRMLSPLHLGFKPSSTVIYNIKNSDQLNQKHTNLDLRFESIGLRHGLSP